jgi:hypothetical protein
LFKATPGVHRTPRKRAEEINRPTAFGGPSTETHYEGAGGGFPLGPGMPVKQEYKGPEPQVAPAASPSKSLKRPFKGG